MTDLLSLHPHIGSQTDNPVIRRLATPPYPYVVFYEVTQTEIIIHAVRHQARNPRGMPGGPQNDLVQAREEPRTGGVPVLVTSERAGRSKCRRASVISTKNRLAL
jgi:ParE toxin of type II toxin-antitoxin system, parDE